MKIDYKKSFSTLALGTMLAFAANAETVEATYTFSFADYAVGTMFNTNGGGQNPGIAVVENPVEGDEGNVLMVSGQDGVSEETGLAYWNTLARIPSISLPKGFNLSQIVMIEAEYMTTQEDNVPFYVKIKPSSDGGWAPDWTDPLACGDAPVVGEWNIAVYDPQEFVYNADGENNKKASSFGFAFGCQGSTNYYVKSFTFYLEKEMTQREFDEEALDKTTAACTEINFDNLEEGPQGNIGSNGGSCNRADMIVDLGPEGYNNKCMHTIYGGYTPIFVYNINAPEGYTFDDLRLLEYDLYETEEAGVDCTNQNSFPGKNGAPKLKVKSRPWDLDNNGEANECGNSPLPTTNEWHHVEFLPSALPFMTRNFQINEGTEEEPVMVDVTWTPEQLREEMGKLTTFAVSLGFFPCLNQCYVDNVKLWFQKSLAQSAIIDVKADKEVEGVTVYNLQGICVLRSADKDAAANLPAGLYIINGKKVLVK